MIDECDGWPGRYVFEFYAYAFEPIGTSLGGNANRASLGNLTVEIRPLSDGRVCGEE